jgi:hypothetical protein
VILAYVDTSCLVAIAFASGRRGGWPIGSADSIASSPRTC